MKKHNKPNLAKIQNLKYLGYDEGSKLLIIHADDLGLSNSTNDACVDLLKKGFINSASLMVTCPWFPQIAQFARTNKDIFDFGVHLTLTSEWKYYKWGPVSSINEVPTLVDDHGFFFSDVNSVRKQGNVSEVELELRNQVKRALDFGIKITHLDAHMHVTKISSEFAQIYHKIGRDYNLPVLFSHYDKDINTENFFTVDYLYQASPMDYEKGLDKYYLEVLKNLPSGLSCLLIHPAFDNEETQAITVGHLNWGSRWRQMDYDFFSSMDYREIIEETGIKFITWRDIQDKIILSDG
ncbi:polysaccharide deacetylase family protein [Maribacter flavus]|uniref:polysaccharide deacetylase family protein n=1 Tax=Maribacter flavus TaxID=1658664 RepID=UPI0013760165|nr:polysaccharide deacetylase family protein [Maribacter flavus]